MLCPDSRHPRGLRRFGVPSVEEIRAQRPREVGTARILSIIAVVLWIPIAGHALGSSSAGFVVAAVCCVFGSFGAVKGRQAARIMVTIALLVIYLLLLPYGWLGFQDPYLNGPGYAVLDLVAVVISAIALILLYRPRSNQYVQLITAARKASA
jgi:hypothetical protein